MRCILVLSLLIGLSSAPGTPPHAATQDVPAIPVTVAAQDPSGAPLKNELVIIQDLDHSEREITRGLTNENGAISPLNLHPGVYRAIVTAPYGLWKTKIQEFLVNDAPVRLTVEVEVMPTRGYGDIVLVGTRHVRLQVLTSDGRPAVGASVLARDEDATLYLERWYRTDTSGEATIEAVGQPLVLVVIFGKTLVTHEFTAQLSHAIVRLP